MSFVTQYDRADAGTQLIHSLEGASFELTTRATLQGQVDPDEYSMDFNRFHDLSVTATATEKYSGSIFYPAEKSEDSIEIPPDWAEYFPNQSIVEFVGIQIIPSHVNRIFVDGGRTPAPSQIVNGNLVSFTFGTPDDSVRQHRRQINLNGKEYFPSHADFPMYE